MELVRGLMSNDIQDAPVPVWEKGRHVSGVVPGKEIKTAQDQGKSDMAGEKVSAASIAAPRRVAYSASTA